MNKLPQDFIEKYGLLNLDSTFLGIKLRDMSFTDLVAVIGYSYRNSESSKTPKEKEIEDLSSIMKNTW